MPVAETSSTSVKECNFFSVPVSDSWQNLTREGGCGFSYEHSGAIVSAVYFGRTTVSQPAVGCHSVNSSWCLLPTWVVIDDCPSMALQCTCS